MYNRITIFDVETPNRFNDKICSIGLVHLVNGNITLKKEYLVDPECEFDSFNIRLHGVSPQMVQGKPTFSETWQLIASYFTNALVVAHNARFDIGVLNKLFAYYGIEAPNIYYVCTVEMAKARLPKQPFNLAALSAALDVELIRHHNALFDTMACMGIYQKLIILRPIVSKEIRMLKGQSAMNDPNTKSLEGPENPSEFDQMRITKVGTRGLLYTMQHIGMPTNVYIINGRRSIYIVDTYLGPDIMGTIEKHFTMAFGNKPKIVINTHSHWDHIWGNCRYEKDLIIAHATTYEAIKAFGKATYDQYDQYKSGAVHLTLPNFTFFDRIKFEEDQLLIWHTPGHTADSIAIYDGLDNVLVVGDNIELPEVGFDAGGTPQLLLKSLASFKGLVDVNTKIIGGHTGVESIEIIDIVLDQVHNKSI